MTIQVIGAGFGRTGTKSLKSALEQLGFEKCYLMVEVNEHNHKHEWLKAHRGQPINWDVLFNGFKATVDWPSCNLWREQLKHFPDAKIILSLRDSASWYESIMNTIYPYSKQSLDSEDPQLHYSGKWAFEIIWDRIFDGRLNEREFVIDKFNRHNQSVIEETPSEKLLIFEAQNGWEPLCDFLGVPVPDTHYPHTNTTNQFKDAVTHHEPASSD